MIKIETEKLKLVKVYLREIIIVALTYALVFLFRIYVGKSNDYDNQLKKDYIDQKARTEFFINMDLKLLKINGSLIQNTKTDSSDTGN